MVHVGKWTYLHVLLSNLDVKVAAECVELRVELLKHLNNILLCHLLRFLLFTGDFNGSIRWHRGSLNFTGRIHSSYLHDRHHSQVEALWIRTIVWEVIINLLDLLRGLSHLNILFLLSLSKHGP